MRIGVLGGTFDPPHSGHLALARAAREQLQLDEVIFVPANRNPLKTKETLTPGKHRLAMVQLLIKDSPEFSVSDMELTRGGSTFSVDTLSELQMVKPADYWFLLGADALKGIMEWKSPLRLARLCRFGAAIRPPMTETDVMARVPADFKEKVDLIRMPPMEVSSTEIRNRVSNKQNLSSWTSPAVLEYIQQNKLYRNS